MASSATQIDTDCKLLLHFDGADASTTFTDDEINTPKTVTPNGSAEIDTAQSKFGGASGRFPGASYLSIPDSGDWDFGTGDFTIDFWVRWNNLTGQPCLVDMQWNGANSGIAISHYSGNLYVYSSLAGPHQFAWTPSNNVWYHVAYIRTGTTIRAFVDGTQIGTDKTDSSNFTGSSSAIGIGRDIANNIGGSFDGWIDELRIVKGTAVWTSNFTPPSAAYTAVGAGVQSVPVIGRSNFRSVLRGVRR